MQEIASGVYLLDDYWGVITGIVVREFGTLLIDSPPCPQHSRLWKARCRNLSQGEVMLAYLDAHPDRTLGARMLETPVVAHEATVNTFNRRPAIFRVNEANRGQAWELCSQIANMRWTPPQMGFSHRLELNWGEEPVVLEHHPGPQQGSAWVFVPDRKVVFVGDSVTVNQPPFLADADIDSWLISLDHLLAPDYHDYFIVSGRDGLVPIAAIRHMQKFLETTKEIAQNLPKNKPSDSDFIAAVSELLAMWPSPFDEETTRLYRQRIVHGLHTYLSNKGQSSSKHHKHNGG